MKPIKGVLCLLCALFLSQAAYAQSTRTPQLRVNGGGTLEIIDSKGKIFSFKSITLQEDVEIDGIKYKVSFGPGANNGDMVAILQPADAARVTVNDPNFPKAAVDISSQALAIFTFNSNSKTVVVESGNLGTVKVNNIALKPGERVAVNADGTLVRNLGSGPAPGTVATNNPPAQNTPGQSTVTEDQPEPEVTDFSNYPGMGNNLLSSFSINLNPEASTPFLPGQ